MADDLYISFDVEADGPYPGRYSMLSVGLCVAGYRRDGTYRPVDPREQTLYVELRPITEHYLSEAMAVNGLDRQRLARTAATPEAAMAQIRAWVVDVSRGRQPVLVAYPATFDWPFLSYYFGEFCDEGPPLSFTRVLDLRTMIVTKSGVDAYCPTVEALPPDVLGQGPHTHHALDDAIQQAELFSRVMAWQRTEGDAIDGGS